MQHLSISSAAPLSLTAAEKELRQANWATLLTQRNITINDTLLRYLSHTATEIKVAPDINYQDVVGLRLSEAPPHPPFLALSAIAFVKTSDNRIILQMRDSGDWPLSLELPGGFIRASMTSASTTDFIRERVARDLGINKRALTSIRLLDFYTFPQILEKMLVFEVLTSQSGNELLAQQKDIVLLPPEYTVPSHADFFALPLHYPTAVVIQKYLPGLL